MSTYRDDRGAPGPFEPPPPPTSVRDAANLMRAGAALSSVVMLLRVRAVSLGGRQQIKQQITGFSTDMVNLGYYTQFISALIGGLLAVGLWLSMAVAAKKGRAGARIASSVLFGIDTLSLLIGAVYVVSGGNVDNLHELPYLVATGVLMWLVGLWTVVLLWKTDSSAFFRLSKLARHAPAGYPVTPQQGGYPGYT